MRRTSTPTPRPPPVPDRIQPTPREALACALEACRRALGERLVSVVVYGSVARCEARPDSDLDLLVVAKDLPRPLRERRAPILEAYAECRPAEPDPPIPLSLVVKTPEEAEHTSPLYLDMVEDAVLLVDEDDFFATVLDRLRIGCGRSAVAGSSSRTGAGTGT